tara:strand:+ start:19 stop:819 length:801 start_codon:yes stop_codon:yes gene_type:complete
MKYKIIFILVLILCNFGYSYYSIKDAYPNEILELLEENGHTGYKIKGTNIPISFLFGSEVIAPVIIEKNGELLKLSPTITPISFPTLQLEYYIEISGLEMPRIGFVNLEENIEEVIENIIGSDAAIALDTEVSLSDCGYPHDSRISFECFYALLEEVINISSNPNTPHVAMVFEIDQKIFWQTSTYGENNMISIEFSGEISGYLTNKTLATLDYYNFTKGGGGTEMLYGLGIRKDELQLKNTALAIYEVIKAYDVPLSSKSTFWLE